MGVIRFTAPGRAPLTKVELAQVYMTGMDELPWQSKAEWTGDCLCVRREVSESGNVHIPWTSPSRGAVMLSTANLVEREKPYQLAVELARGTLFQVRNQLGAWEMIGLVVPDALRYEVREVTKLFSSSATAQDRPLDAAEIAGQVIERSLELIEESSRSYAHQAIAVRKRQSPTLGTFLAINLGASVPSKEVTPLLLSAFNAAIVPLSWRTIAGIEGKPDWSLADEQMRWCQENGLKICSGPLLEFENSSVPNWAFLWEGDFDHLVGLIQEHVRSVGSRYQQKVHLWQVVGRSHRGKFLSLEEEHRLHMVVRATESLRQVAPRTPQVIGFDQPWGEYLAHEELDFSPLHFADALVRGQIGLSGLGLEINQGYYPGGSLRHGPIGLSRLLDRWSMLGLPLVATIAAPSNQGMDERATMKTNVLAGSGEQGVTPESQAAWIEQTVPLLLAKNCVQVIAWNEYSDADEHEFPFSGLVNAQGEPKPALESFRKLREKLLGK